MEVGVVVVVVGVRRRLCQTGATMGGTYVVEMRELDFHGRREEGGSGLDNHRHHLGVEQGAVAVETKDNHRWSVADSLIASAIL